MDLISHYNSIIVEGFDRYHIPDLNLETAKIIFFLESGHIDEIPNQKPLCGESGKNFTKNLFEHSIPFGLWYEKPQSIGVLESSPFPLQKSAYIEYFKSTEYPINTTNSKKVECFQSLRDIVYDFKFGDKTELINHLCNLPDEILNTNLYKDYCNRVDNVFESEIIQSLVICGLFAQRFFNSYLFGKQIEIKIPVTDQVIPNTGTIIIDSKEIHLIYINHPKEWKNALKHENDCNYDRFMKNTVEKIKEIITELK